MSKKLFAIAFLMLLTMPVFAGQIIVSDEHPGKTTDLPADLAYVAAEVQFTLDSTTTVIITTNGTWYSPTNLTWIKIDSDSVGLTTIYGCNRTYFTTLPQGEHSIKLVGRTSHSDDYFLENIYLQVLIFTPDIKESVMENLNTNDPINPRAILATGVSVHVDNCNSVYDITGRKINCQITNDEVMINTLPEGTYIAKSTTGSVTKIVKIN